ncbi:MAG: DMT family transporter [Anaerovoracaceae bacterium]|jgi:drug/metabolite transporter (DMT)-like permease|nr:DMT family transporter [Anaerovoracaceae bacterium]
MTTKTRGYLYILLAVSAWGSLYVAGKFVLETMPVTLLLASRYLIGLAVLFFVFRKMPKATIEKGDRKYILYIGGIAYYLAVALQLLGTQLCDASLASLLNSTNPIFMVLLALPLLGERLSFKKLISVLITVLGAGIIIGGVESGNFLGIIINLGSVFAWSFGSLMMKKACLKYDPISITIYSMSVGFLFSLPTVFLELTFSDFQWSSLSPMTLLWVLYIGVVCTAGALLYWNKGLAILDAGTGSLFLPVQPVVSTFLGVLVLGEIVTFQFLLGSFLVILGILYAVLPASFRIASKREIPSTLS